MQMNMMATGALENGDKASEAFGAACDTANERRDMKPDALFERFSARLKAQVGQDVYASWFARLKLHSVSKSVVRLTVPTTFLKSWINNRYIDLITGIFQAEDAEILKVEILVRTATRSVRPAAAEEATPAGDPPAPHRIAAIGKCGRAVDWNRTGRRSGEHDIAPMRIPDRGRQLRPSQQSGNRAGNRGGIARLFTAECQQHPALVIIADRRNMAGIIEECVQGSGCLEHAIADFFSWHAANRAEPDEQHFKRECAVGG